MQHACSCDFPSFDHDDIHVDSACTCANTKAQFLPKRSCMTRVLLSVANLMLSGRIALIAASYCALFPALYVSESTSTAVPSTYTANAVGPSPAGSRK